MHIGLYIGHVNEDTLWPNDDDATKQDLRSFRTVHEKMEFCTHRKSVFNEPVNLHNNHGSAVLLKIFRPSNLLRSAAPFPVLHAAFFCLLFAFGPRLF